MAPRKQTQTTTPDAQTTTPSTPSTPSQNAQNGGAGLTRVEIAQRAVERCRAALEAAEARLEDAKTAAAAAEAKAAQKAKGSGKRIAASLRALGWSESAIIAELEKAGINPPAAASAQ